MKSIALLILVAPLATLLSLPAHANCPAPANPGATICFPSNGSTVTYPMNIGPPLRAVTDCPSYR